MADSRNPVAYDASVDQIEHPFLKKAPVSANPAFA
jgi:hypothetical protein